MAPAWVDFGAMLGIFGTFLGVVLASQLKTVFRSDFGRFLIDFRPIGGAKALKNIRFFKDVCFFSGLFAPETDSGLFLHRFCFDCLR